MDDTDRSDDIEARLRRLEDLEEIKTLYVDYGRHLDSGDADAYASLFARSAKLRLGAIMRGDGRDEIRQAAAALVGQRPEGARSFAHVLGSPRIELDGDTASGECVWAAVSKGRDGEPKVLVGRHFDQLVREEGQWRFSLRRGVFDVGSGLP
jgi:ketosteroid isomerase-like protein